MIQQALILLTFVLLHTSVKSAIALTKADANSTSPLPKETSYFYRNPQGPGTYEFGYRIEDEETGNMQFREEKRYSNGTITGMYGYLRPDGKTTVTNYIADENGYRKRTKTSKHQSSSTPRTPTMSTRPNTTGSMDPPGLNLTEVTLPPELVKDVKEEYNIDLGPEASPLDALSPDISEIISGTVPLTKDNKSSELGFEVVQNFIPNDFPIVPFQLPPGSVLKLMTNQTKS